MPACFCWLEIYQNPLKCLLEGCRPNPVRNPKTGEHPGPWRPLDVTIGWPSIWGAGFGALETLFLQVRASQSPDSVSHGPRSDSAAVPDKDAQGPSANPGHITGPQLPRGLGLGWEHPSASYPMSLSSDISLAALVQVLKNEVSLLGSSRKAILHGAEGLFIYLLIFLYLSSLLVLYSGRYFCSFGGIANVHWERHDPSECRQAGLLFTWVRGQSQGPLVGPML